MQEPSPLILTALADAPRHGYALSREIVVISQGRVKLRTGTLYGSLERLQEEGLVEVFAEERGEGRLRRTYTLTSDGRQAPTAANKSHEGKATLVAAEFAHGALAANRRRSEWSSSGVAMPTTADTTMNQEQQGAAGRIHRGRS